MDSKIFARINFDPGILVILSLVISIIVLVAVLVLLFRMSKLELNYRIFMKGKSGKSLEEVFHQQLDEFDLVKEQTELLHKRMLYIEKSFNKSFQKFGIVKYDAFKEVGGKLSFAFAILNDSNSGFVMNCIHSREGSYTYIKDVVRGDCDVQLCEEEAEAIQLAIDSINTQSTAAMAKAERKKVRTQTTVRDTANAKVEGLDVTIKNQLKKVKVPHPKKTNQPAKAEPKKTEAKPSENDQVYQDD